MTKPLTTLAALQLVERGLIDLDEPVSKFVSALATRPILRGFAHGRPQLERSVGSITLRHLLAHTSGFAYDFCNSKLAEYLAVAEVPSVRTRRLASLEQPIVSEPGVCWEYGISTDWVGRIVEAISGADLRKYFKAHITMPLGMTDTDFIVDHASSRLVDAHRRATGATFEAIKPSQESGEFYGGGGGLYSTAPDYMKFLQCLLQGGRCGDRRVLSENLVREMFADQTGGLRAGRLASCDSSVLSEIDLASSAKDTFGFGLLINTEVGFSGRSPYSGGWAGLWNSFFWIDPASNLAVVVLMQLAPFGDRRVMEWLRWLERSLYRAYAAR
jgi:CubicO group peptidase (beta-lactamase class C family)